MKIVIAIDDLHPEQGWGCEGDESNLIYSYHLIITTNIH